MSDDYLWDKSGTPDPEVARLEEALAPLRHRDRDWAAAEPTRRRRAIVLAPIALAAAVLLAIGVWNATREKGPTLAVSGLAGTERLGIGHWLETDAQSRATIELDKIGVVDVDPGSRVRLVTVSEHEQRLELARGSISARVLAPPRLFVVDTPSARAIDLGCAYRLDVTPEGGGLLTVTSGSVELAGNGHAAYVPAFAACETRPGKGPGCPYFTDASLPLKQALRRFDFEGANDALATVLAEARARDTLTLWHLQARTTGAERETILERLGALAPSPDPKNPRLEDMVTHW